MKDYIIDTNILIYLFENNQKSWQKLSELVQDQFCISPISRLEFLIGLKKEDEDCIKTHLDDLLCLDVNLEISNKAANLFKNHPSLKFKDALILATAHHHKKTLITADKKLAKIAEKSLLFKLK